MDSANKSPESPEPRLRELAKEGARYLHNIRAHRDRFDLCPDPDCRLVREGVALVSPREPEHMHWHEVENRAMKIVEAIRREFLPTMDSNGGGEILRWLTQFAYGLRPDIKAGREAEYSEPFGNLPKLSGESAKVIPAGVLVSPHPPEAVRETFDQMNARIKAEVRRDEIDEGIITGDEHVENESVGRCEHAITERAMGAGATDSERLFLAQGEGCVAGVQGEGPRDSGRVVLPAAQQEHHEEKASVSNHSLVEWEVSVDRQAVEVVLPAAPPPRYPRETVLRLAQKVGDLAGGCEPVDDPDHDCRTCDICNRIADLLLDFFTPDPDPFEAAVPTPAPVNRESDPKWLINAVLTHATFREEAQPIVQELLTKFFALPLGVPPPAPRQESDAMLVADWKGHLLQVADEIKLGRDTANDKGFDLSAEFAVIAAVLAVPPPAPDTESIK